MVAILHVSDLQFGVQHRFGRLGLGGADEAFDTLLGRLTEDLDRLREQEGLTPDLVALTGDLAEWARPREYADVLRFCEGLRAHLSLAPDRLLVVPGNHDISRDHCEGYFAVCKGDDEPPVEPWWPKWGPYRDFFGKLYQTVDRYEFKETAPYTWFELPELRLVVAGLNSTMRESHRERDPNDPESIFGHYGYLGEAQLEWFRRRLDEAAAKQWLRIGMVHHNALRKAADDDENLRDAALLEDRLGGRLNLLLHGHTHSGGVGWLGRDLPVISTGSAAVKLAQRPEETPNQYQIVQIGPDGFRCWARQYTPASRKFIGDPRVSRDGRDWRHTQAMQFPGTTGTFGAREAGAASGSPFDDDDADEDPHRSAREAHDLLAQVMTSCRVRDESGLVQTARVRSRGQWGDHCRVSDPARGTYLLGAHPGPLTLELLERWTKDVHEPFRSKGNPGQTSDLVVSTSQPIAGELKQRAGRSGVYLWRRLDYERVIDSERWKQQQLARLDADREYRRDLYVEQRVTLWSPLDDVKEQVHPAADRIVRMLCEGDEGCFVMVLGPAGTGKTFLLREVARRITERYATVTPLLVELRGLERAQDVYELVNFEFSRRKQVLPARAFERDLQEGRIALLFDGFDELAIRVRSAAIPEHFARILGAARGQARVIVASRAEHFVSHRDAVERLMSRASPHSAGLAGQLQAISQRRLVATHKFTHEDIEQYLARALGSAEAGRARMDRFRKVHDLPGLAATPRMLAFLVRLTDEQLDLAAARRDAITSAELYRLVIVDHWLAQQEERFNPPGSAPGPTREALLESATRLALHMWRSTARHIAASALDAHTGQQLRRLCEDDGDAAKQTLQGRTLLIHGESGQFEFVHQTVMEWLVAQVLAAELAAHGACADLEHGRLGDFMVDVLRELLGDDALVGWATRVLEGAPDNRLAENARIALAMMKREVTVRRADLRGQDLRGQSLAGQDLRGALLDGADLRGCDLAGRDLRGASMNGTNLATASLRGADLTGASLRGADLLYANLGDADLSRVDLSGADLSFARLGRCDLGDARLDDAVLLGTSFLEARGAVPSGVVTRIDGVGRLALARHPALSPCNTVACSPRGWVVASGHHDGSVRLWDIVRDRLLRVLWSPGSERIDSVAWSPDGAWLASTSQDGAIRLWRTGDGALRRTLASDVRVVCFAPDGRVVAGGCGDGRVRLWSLADEGPARVLPGEPAHMITSVAFAPDGGSLASGSFDRKVRIWRLDPPGEPTLLHGHERGVVGVAWSPDGAALASASYDGTVRMWQVHGGEAPRVLAGHDTAVMGVAWSPDGHTLVTHAARALRVWQSDTWRDSRLLATDPSLVRGVSWVADGATIASGSYDGKLRIRRLADGAELSALTSAATVTEAALTWRPDASAFAVNAASDVQIWSVPGGKLLRRFYHGSSLGWAPDGDRIASVEGASIHVWSVVDDDPPRVLAGSTSAVTALAWSRRGDRIAGASEDGMVRIWRASGGELHAVLDHGVATRGRRGSAKVSVTSLAFGAGDEPLLATGGTDGFVHLWREQAAGTPQLVTSLGAHAGPVTRVAWSPDGASLASAGCDCLVKLWHGNRHTQEFTTTATAVALAWSPDGARVAALLDQESALCVWGPDGGQVRHTLEIGAWRDLRWSLDGRHVVIEGGHADTGVTWLIEADSGRLVETLRALRIQAGGTVIVRGDGRHCVYGEVDGELWHTVGLHRYELGELDEHVPGGLQLSMGGLLFAAGMSRG